ncbi:MAG: serine hydrolase [Chloroflexi bacterium]|nr:serine hydrolase [Chloroflexota bacterium]
MSHPKRVYTLLGVLILTGILSVTAPATTASAESFPLQQVDRDSIDAYVRSRMQAANIPGLALGVVRGDEIVYLQGYGIAGADGRPVTGQTPFILGSTTKSFTALAVMQLVEAGRIDLDTPVTAYLPWFRTKDASASAQITVRNLLHQDSGLPELEGRQGLGRNDQSDTALEDGVRELSGVTLRHPAGQHYEYSNLNYNILGLIVQTVSGMSYEEYIDSAIFAPLQMSHSAASPTHPVAAGLATGYRYWLFWPVAFDAPYPRHMTPSGFLMSSAEDMAHYLIAQLNGGVYGDEQVLTRQGIETLHTPGARIGAESSYGMGWVVEGQPGSTRLWHNGDVSNFHSNLLLLPEQHLGIVVLVNIGGFLNSSAINIPIEGIAEILVGSGLTARTNPPVSVISQTVMLAVLLVPALWVAGSYASVRRWQRNGDLPPRGPRRFWQFYLPLTIDVLLAVFAWFVVPAQFDASMETVALFAPDAFAVIAIVTVVSIGWAVARTVLTLHPRRSGGYASG